MKKAKRRESSSLLLRISNTPKRQCPTRVRLRAVPMLGLLAVGSFGCKGTSDELVELGADTGRDGAFDAGAVLTGGEGFDAGVAADAGVVADEAGVDAGLLEPCEGGSWGLPGAAGECMVWSECAAGTYVSREGSSLRDRQCEPCAEGSYAATTNASECVPWSVCSAGQHVSSAGTATADVTCTGCASGSFSTADNASECSVWTECGAGQYVHAEGTSSADRQCAPCAEGTFSSGPNQAACLPAGSCPAGTLQTAEATQASDAVCEPCSVGSYCAGGAQAAVVCADDSWDHDADPATACTARTACTNSEYETHAGSATQDRACAALTVCSSEQYETTAPTATSDRVCQALTVCNSATQYESVAPTATSDRTCTQLTTCQNDEYETSAPTPTEDRLCELLTVCSVGSQEVTAATATSDRVCEACSSGEYCAGGSEPAVTCADDGSVDHDADPVTPCRAYCTIQYTEAAQARGLPYDQPGISLAWADIDANGRPDLAIAGQGLYVQQEDGSFVDEAISRGVTNLGLNGYAVAAGDYNGDGLIDLFFAGETRSSGVDNRLYQNAGATFSDVSTSAGLVLASNTSRSAVFFDHDRDNDLDILYSNEFGTYAMFRNDGSLPFASDNSLFSTPLQGDAAAFADYDGDFDYDLFIATGSGAAGNRLFVADGGAWTDSAAAAGVAGSASDPYRWGAANWVDIDGDTDLDLFVVNASSDDLAHINNGDGTFSTLLGSSLGLPEGSFSTSPAWFDADLDGDLDVFLAGKLMLNEGGSFVEQGLSNGHTVAAFADVNGDLVGDLVTGSYGALSLYLGGFGSDCVAPNSLSVRALTDGDGNATDGNTADDRDAIGARITVDLDGDGDFLASEPDSDRVVTHLIGAAQSGRTTRNDLLQLIGMGQADSVDIRVTFVDGSQVTLLDQAAGTLVVVRDTAD